MTKESDNPSLMDNNWVYGKIPIAVFSFCIAILLQFTPLNANSLGSVYLEDDLCTIRIAYFRAHFKLYLPRSRQHEEFCEELPETGESVFVFEYIDPNLGSVPFDFRIIRNVTGRKRFADEDDIARIVNLEDVTEFYISPRIEPDVFTAVHRFDNPGAYIGIVTAKRPDTGEIHTSVFSFQVGFAGFGIWPFLFISIVLYFIFIAYSYGWISRHRIRGIFSLGFRGEASIISKVQE